MSRVKGANIVVTGGAGFIGAALVSALVEAGAKRVVVIDDLRAGELSRLSAAREVLVHRHSLGSASDGALDAVLEGGDVLFHFAAEKHNQAKDEPRRILETNVLGTQSLFDRSRAAGIRKIVFASSLFAYGRMNGSPLVETERAEPTTVYGASKLCGEHLLATLAREHGVDAVSLRFFFVYGPKQFAGMGYKSVILRSIERLSRGEAPVVFGDGAQALDYVFVDDAVRATIAAMESEVTGEVINVGSGVPTTVRSLLERLVEVSGTDAPLVDGPADWTAGSRRVADVTKAASLLGFEATTSLAEGLSRTLAWARSS